VPQRGAQDGLAWVSVLAGGATGCGARRLAAGSRAGSGGGQACHPALLLNHGGGGGGGSGGDVGGRARGSGGATCRHTLPGHPYSHLAQHLDRLRVMDACHKCGAVSGGCGGWWWVDGRW